VRAGCEHLASQQTELGSWAGDYGGPMFLLPMYVLVAHFAEHEIPRAKRDEMVRYLRHAQNPDGSVGVYEGGPGCVFTSSLAYAALRMLGVSPDDSAARRMASWVRGQGTPLRAAPWGKFSLALVDLYDYDGLDPITPELWLLPYAVPFHPGRMWCHARQVYLPMAYLYARRARRPADALVRAIRDELYGEGYERIDWRAHRASIATSDAYRPSTRWLTAVNRVLDVYERIAPARLRTRAIEETFRHIAYEDDVTSFIRIGPVNAVLNTACHADRTPRGENVRKSFETLEQYLWSGPDGIKMQGYNSSQLWDTAFAVQSVLATPYAREFAPMIDRAHTYIRDNQILDDVPNPEAHYRHRSRGGWPFSNRPHGWPITDCTAEGFKCAVALEGRVDRPVDRELLEASVELMLSFQNDDGGWSTYERQRAGAWLEALNPSQVFGDIMVDYSFTECTSAVMQALAKARVRFAGNFDAKLDDAIARGAHFLRAKQDASGGWEGSWGVCFTYGTWFGVSGLLASGARADDPAIARACRFLLERQNRDGSWGERPDSCWERRYVPHAEGQVVMTSWALSTLVRARHDDHDAIARAVRFLVDRQRTDGGWARESLAGVFNRTCMINYDNYRLYFPVWALGEWLATPPTR
jgi:squalene/oxidosqualene cyclase-like protein